MVQKNLGKSVKCIVLGGLCITSVLFTKEVVKKFNSENTSFMQYKEPIIEHPTIAICFEDMFKYYDTYFKLYGYNFSLTYNQEILNLGENILNNYVTILLEKMTTYASGTCYKIITSVKEMNIYGTTEIGLVFHENIPVDDLPPISLFITSLKNSHGILFNEWRDGNAPWIILDKVEHYYSIGISIKLNLLKSHSKQKLAIKGQKDTQF